MRIDGQCRRIRFHHEFYRRYAHHRHIKAHVLLGLAYLDNGDGLIARQGGCPPNHVISTFHRLHRNAGLITHDDRLPDIHAGDFAGNAPSVFNVLSLTLIGSARR